MKGYKGFNKGLICRGKQYAENSVFEEEKAEICKNGMHFCENPFDVLYYYGFVDDNGNVNDFAEVEALDEVKKEGNKCCTKRLRIGTKIGISGLVAAFVSFTLEKTNEKVKNVTGNCSAATNTGDCSAATNTGNRSAATVEGKESVAVATGYHSKAKGALGCWIVVAERNDDGKILTILAAEVDGKKIKPDTFYMVEKGEFVEYIEAK